MEGTINQSFSEVYDIIMHMQAELYKKIPKSFVEMLKQNKDDSYIVKIDYSKNINEQKILYETRIILSLIYRDYLCSPEEKEKLIQLDKIQLEQNQQELKTQYDPNNLFAKTSINNNSETIQAKEINVSPPPAVVVKDNIFKRIINLIKRADSTL